MSRKRQSNLIEGQSVDETIEQPVDDEQAVEQPVEQPVIVDVGISPSVPKVEPVKEPVLVKTEDMVTIIKYAGHAFVVPATAESVKACWDTKKMTVEQFVAYLTKELGCEPQMTYRGANVYMMTLMGAPLGFTVVNLV